MIGQSAARAFTVRKAEAADLAAIERIYTEATQRGWKHYSKPVFHGLVKVCHPRRDYLFGNLPNCVVVAVKPNLEVVGFAWAFWDQKALFLQGVFSGNKAPAGTGRQLVEAVVERSQGLPYTSMEVIAPKEAIGFYEKCGFQFVAPMPYEVQGGIVEAGRLTRPFSGSSTRTGNR